MKLTTTSARYFSIGLILCALLATTPIETSARKRNQALTEQRLYFKNEAPVEIENSGGEIAPQQNIPATEKVEERIIIDTQKQENPPIMKEYDLEVLASFPGGMEAMYQFLANHLTYPSEAEEKGITGQVVVQFVVDKMGDISDLKIVRSIHPLLDEEALRVIRLMPRWVPAKAHGVAVYSQYMQPIVFRLQ